MSTTRAMDAVAQKAAIHAMKELMTHPLTIKFHFPVPHDDSSASQEYYATVKNPRDLSSIQNKLVSGSYSTVSEWLADIDLVWSNAETFYHDDVHTAVTDECRRIFETIISKTGIYPFDLWCRDVFDLEKRYQRKIQDAPLKVRQTLGGMKQKKRENKFTDEELAHISEMYRMLTPSEKINVSIMFAETEEYPGVGYEEMWINLDSLRTGLAERLKKHIAGLLKKRGIKFSSDEEEESSDDGTDADAVIDADASE